MQGKSVLPLLRSENEKCREEWFYEYFEWPNPECVSPHKGIRTLTHKLIVYTQNESERELYNLMKDPMETLNLWGQPEHAAIQQELLARMEALASKIPARSGSDVG